MQDDCSAPAAMATDPTLPPSVLDHRVRTLHPDDVLHGSVHWEPRRSLWFSAMALGALIGGPLYFSWSALLLFLVSTGTVLLLGHSLGMHRKLIHDSYQCPKWLEYLLVWCGTQVGLAGPLSLLRTHELRTHELRDYAQRLPRCHDFLAHRRRPLQDAWWQLHCELKLQRPPTITVDAAIADDRFHRGLEATWKLQHLLVAVLLWSWGGWGFVFWGVCARVTAGVFGHWLIGWFAHNRGEQSHVVNGASVQGHNVRWTSLLTMGECWHNSHHAWPGSARLGVLPGQWDPGWWMLKGLQKLGLVWNLRLPADLPVRAELRTLPAAMQRLRGTGLPRGLRATAGRMSRRHAVGALIEQALVGVAAAWAMLVGTLALLGALLSLLLALWNGQYLDAAAALPTGLMAVAVLLVAGLVPAGLLWLYASVCVLLLVQLGRNSRLAFAVVGALPLVALGQSHGAVLDPLGALAIASAVFGALTAHHRILRLTLAQRQQHGPTAIVVHDGGSSLCRRFARMLPARFLGRLQIGDSRQDGQLRVRLLAARLNPEHGLIVLTADGALQGAAALRWLARRTAPGVRWLAADLLFASPLAYVLYPLFRGVRALQLCRAGLPRLDRMGALA